MTTVMTPGSPAGSGGPELTGALRFVEPLPGFEAEDAYTLSAIDPHGVLLAMRSVRNPSLRFVVTPSDCFFSDYRPELPPSVTSALGAGSEAVRLLLILTIGDHLADATANLRAPIVVDDIAGTAMQVVLDDETLPMHQRVV